MASIIPVEKGHVPSAHNDLEDDPGGQQWHVRTWLDSDEAVRDVANNITASSTARRDSIPVMLFRASASGTCRGGAERYLIGASDSKD